MSTMLSAVTSEDYARIFETERLVEYPVVDAFEQQMGFALARPRLEQAARILACPLKAHAPNWQHGRVIYAATMKYLAQGQEPVLLLDVGTAKGFSALCFQWALYDAATHGLVVSVDVIDPKERVRRNTVLEIHGYKTLAETLSPWPEAQVIRFQRMTGAEAIVDWPRVHIAYLDGKHTFDAVSTEVALLTKRQRPGDLVIWDDAQIDGVARAIAGASKHYAIDSLDVLPHRRYAIGVRRG